MECIICFNDIEENNNSNYIKLECCSQYVHLNCLELWITTNIDKNTEIELCIYCKKNNLFIKEIIQNLKNLDLSENNCITNTNNNNNNNTNNDIIIINNDISSTRFTSIVCIILILIVIFISY